jgi:hypothetical protein
MQLALILPGNTGAYATAGALMPGEGSFDGVRLSAFAAEDGVRRFL